MMGAALEFHSERELTDYVAQCIRERVGTMPTVPELYDSADLLEMCDVLRVNYSGLSDIMGGGNLRGGEAQAMRYALRYLSGSVSVLHWGDAA